MGIGHMHSHASDAASRTSLRLALSFCLTLAFVIVESIAGVWANSLALLTDAAHNFTDLISLALSWYAFRLTTQPAHSGKTFGYHRAGILVALVNSTTLALIALGIFYEAYQRLIAPPEVNAGLLIQVGALAFVVNLVTAWLVRHGSKHDLNLRSAYLHLLGDVASTIGAVLAGIGIMLTGMLWLDPVASVLIGFLILWNAWGILRETVNILLESTPGDIDMSRMVRDLMQIAGVRGVHDLHVWSISQNVRALSAHIVTDDVALSSGSLIQHRINEVLSHRYGIVHATLQLECANCEPDQLYCDIASHSRCHGPAPGDKHAGVDAS
jgi:cobalt-zinc-cadmium efflux system protein